MGNSVFAPFHVCAFSASLGSVTDSDVAAVADTVLFVDNSNHFLLRTPMRLLAAWAGGTTLARIKLHSGQLSYQGDPQIRPIDGAAVPPNNPNVMFRFKNEMVLPMGEGLQCLATTNAVGPAQTTLILVVADATQTIQAAMRPDKVISPSLGFQDSDRELRGNIFPVRLTSTAAAVANKWTQLTGSNGLSYQVALPGGKWQIVCSEHESANAQAHRWVFPYDAAATIGDRPLWRPGFLSITSLVNRTDRLWYAYPWGPLGNFLSDIPPILEVLCNGADASHECYQWLRLVGNGAGQ